MELRKKNLELKKIGLISSFLAIAVYIVGTTAAMLAYPDYSFMNQFLSELGVRINFYSSEGWTMIKAPYPEIFNVTLILNGVLFIPFFSSTYFILKPKRIISKITQIVVSVSGLVTGGFLICAGIFDAGTFIDQHVTAALGLYYCLIITSLLWGLGVLTLNKDNIYKKSKLWIIDPIASLIGISIGVINTGLFNLDEVFIGKLSMAFYQKMLGYVFILLFGYVAIRLFLILRKDMYISKIIGEEI